MPEPTSLRPHRPRRALLALALALAPACGDDGDATGASAGDTSSSTGATTDATATTAAESTTGADTGGDADLLSAPEHLIRVAMALRGMRPSEADLAAVEADPAALPAIVDAYLDTPEFGATVREVYNDAFLSLIDFALPPGGFLPKGPVAGADPYALNRAIMEAPLRLVEHVVMDDRPLTEIVTADYTYASPEVAAVWGLDHGGGGWQEVPVAGKRTAAGVLSDSWLWTRHSSTITNANRGRASAMARALLCHDFLDREISIDTNINLADPNVVAKAVEENPSCAACHQTLDPLASFFSGYLPNFAPALLDYPIETWVPGLFDVLFKVNLRDPAYYGAPGDDLRDLGEMIADDPRFSLCAARRFYAHLHQLPVEEVSAADAADAQALLLGADMRVKALVKELVLADEFRRRSGDLNPKRARPGQLARLIDDLTGFRWRTDLSLYGVGVIDLMDDSLIGFQVLGGGIDSYYVTRPAYPYNATASLVLQGLARTAANYVVESDLGQADPKKRVLLTKIATGQTDEPSVRAQLASIFRRLYGDALAADDPQITAAYQLFAAALAGAPLKNPKIAWKITLTALLQDHRIAFY